MLNSFNDQIILITGGNSGIGLSCAKKLISLGAKIVIIDLVPFEDSFFSNQESSIYKMIDYQCCDLTDMQSTKEMFNGLSKKYNRLDGAIHSAGVIGSTGKRFCDYSTDEYNYVMDVNAKSIWFCMQEELKIMERQGSGSIVNISSVAGLRGSLLSAIYSMSKFAVNGLTCAAALEYAPKGIRINAICPGPTDTPLSQKASASSKELSEIINNSIPMHRVGEAQEVANFAVWLLSNEASFVTGALIPVDGGIIAKI